jgi:hypothetical protein
MHADISRSKFGLILAFDYVTDNGRVSELRIPQSRFFQTCHARLPIAVDFEDDDVLQYDFQLLVGTGSEDYLAPLWESFQSFEHWVAHGKYVHHEISGTHIDSYVLADILSSPGFADAVMREIMSKLPGQKFDLDLKNSYRQVFSKFPIDSPLRQLYFDAAMYWRLYFGGGGTEDVHWTKSFDKRVLGLDPSKDVALLQALQKHKAQYFSGEEPLGNIGGGLHPKGHTGSGALNRVKAGRIGKSKGRGMFDNTKSLKTIVTYIKQEHPEDANNSYRLPIAVAPWDPQQRQRYFLEV